MHSVAGVVDGEIIAIGGIARVGVYATGFLYIDDRAKRYPVTLCKTAIEVLHWAADHGWRRIFATYDSEDETAKHWMERLGFRPIPNNEHAVMVWQV